MTPTDDIDDDDTVFTYDGGIPLHPVHPGRTIVAELQARHLTPHRAALLMRIPANRLSQIIAAKRGVTADTALRLARLLGPSAPFWMTLQAQHDLATTERERGQAIREEVPVLEAV
jgi:addiction module HigA family antidote